MICVTIITSFISASKTFLNDNINSGPKKSGDNKMFPIKPLLSEAEWVLICLYLQKHVLEKLTINKNLAFL